MSGTVYDFLRALNSDETPPVSARSVPIINKVQVETPMDVLPNTGISDMLKKIKHQASQQTVDDMYYEPEDNVDINESFGDDSVKGMSMGINISNDSKGEVSIDINNMSIEKLYEYGIEDKNLQEHMSDARIIYKSSLEDKSTADEKIQRIKDTNLSIQKMLTETDHTLDTLSRNIEEMFAKLFSNPSNILKNIHSTEEKLNTDIKQITKNIVLIRRAYISIYDDMRVGNKTDAN
jgi:hypothetical protein